MAHHGIVTGETFSVFRRYLQSKNVKLPVIAEQVISTGSLPD